MIKKIINLLTSCFNRQQSRLNTGSGSSLDLRVPYLEAPLINNSEDENPMIPIVSHAQEFKNLDDELDDCPITLSTIIIPIRLRESKHATAIRKSYEMGALIQWLSINPKLPIDRHLCLLHDKEGKSISNTQFEYLRDNFVINHDYIRQRDHQQRLKEFLEKNYLTDQEYEQLQDFPNLLDDFIKEQELTVGKISLMQKTRFLLASIVFGVFAIWLYLKKTPFELSINFETLLKVRNLLLLAQSISQNVPTQRIGIRENILQVVYESTAVKLSVVSIGIGIGLVLTSYSAVRFFRQPAKQKNTPLQKLVREYSLR